MKRAKSIIITVAIFLICTVLYVLFRQDLQIIGSQVAAEAGLIANEPVIPFVLNGGIIEYVDEESGVVTAVTYPSLQSVSAVLEIPRIGISGQILDGASEELLDRGFWHYPSESPYSPSGNVVIIGHRFLKLPPHKDTFYHLDWVKPGDDIMIKTKSDTFTYRAREKKIVKNTEVQILQQTLNPQLTLVTCHPLWTSAERLVIIADRVGE
jgi:LPXTG-site transpeptidase (sortase) family protein